MEAIRKNRTQIIVLAILAVLLFMAIQGMSTRDWVVTVLRGLSVGAITFLVASGFSIILGLMDVLNLAHGTLFMIGAYLGWSVYVRPDSFVDLLTPMTLVLAGLLLIPLFSRLLGRLKLPKTVDRIWPFVGLAAALGLLVPLWSRAPIALWSPDVYTDSPIVWSQNMDLGTVASLVQPASWEGIAPILGLAGLILVGLLAGLSLAGLSRREGTVAGKLPLRPLAYFGIVVALGLLIYVGNDALTGALLGMDTTLLFLIAIVVATVGGAALGSLIEFSMIRPLYDRAIYQIMLTFGLAFIGTEIVRGIWGRTGFTMPRPSMFNGSGEGCPADSFSGWLQHRCATIVLEIGGETARIRTYNEIFVIVVGLVVLVAVWLLLQRSRLGMIIRAGVQDGEMVQALGINVRRVFTLVFGLGVGLAALGGVLAGPSMGLSDGMGAHLLLGALIALAIGGLTSYPGAAAGSLLVGLVQQFIIKYGSIGINLPFMAEPFKPSPPLVPASTVLLMVIILLVMPQGLFGRKE